MSIGFREFLEAEAEPAPTELYNRNRGNPTPIIKSGRRELQRIMHNLAYRVKNLEREIGMLKSRTVLSPQERDPSVWVLP